MSRNYELMGQYLDAVGREGPQGPTPLALRRDHAADAEFVAFADRIDRLKAKYAAEPAPRPQPAVAKPKIAGGLSGLDILYAALFCGAAGALIGFGLEGTLQAMAMGGGIGMVVPIIVLIIAGPPPD